MKSMKKSIFLLAIIALILLASTGEAGQGEKTMVSKHASAPTAAGTLNKDAVMAKAASLAVPFVRNAGRFNKEVLYSADLFSGRFFLTDKELVYSLVQRAEKNNARQDRVLAFREFFIDEKGNRISFEPAGEERGTTKISYFRGNDPAKWQSGLASYQSVSLGDVFPGISVKLRASGKNVEKMFYLSPGSDVALIRIGVAGVAGLRIADDGRLIFKNGLGELAMRAPVAWQEIDGRRRNVKVGYRLLGKQRYGFVINGEFDKGHPLVIDPELDTLLASTFLGGSNDDFGYALALDSKGNVYVSGYTYSANFPTTLQAYDRAAGGSQDVFVSKLNNNLTELLASTFLSGSSREVGNSLALDGAGNVFVAGSTDSADFPTTPGGYDRTYNGGSGYHSDAFVSKLDGDLTTLLASTFLGGSHDEQSSSLALKGSGEVYLSGTTGSIDFPVTTGAYDRTNNGREAFISKMDRNLTKLMASTFLGGSDFESGNSLALDGSGKVYLTGRTFSADFPTTTGAYDRTYNGDNNIYYYRGDVFISKLNGSLTTLLSSTYLGGGYNESATSLALGGTGDVYLTGSTSSPDFPTTPKAYDRKFGEFSSSEIFVSKLDADLTSLLAATFLGGDDGSSYYGSSLALDSFDNVFVTGGYEYEYHVDSVWSVAFAHKLSGNLAQLLGSITFDKSSEDWGRFLALDRAGNVFLTGCTGGRHEDRFPTTPGAYDRIPNGGSYDAFITKLNGNSDSIIIVNSPNGGEGWVAGTAHDIAWASTGKIANVRIELSTDNGASWSEVAIFPARNHKYPWIVPNAPSRECLVRISDVANVAASDASDAVFSILMNIDLVAERREVRAFSVVRQYGQIHFLVDSASQQAAGIPGMLRKQGIADALRKNSAFPEVRGKYFLAHGASVQVDQYRLMRRQGDGEFALLKAIAPSELKNNQFIMQDKYLEKSALYTYRIEAYNAAGQLIGISAEKTI